MSAEELQDQWPEHLQGARIRVSPTFEDAGLVLGAGTVLANLTDDQERLRALLSAAYRRSISPEALGHVRAATARWRQGSQDRAVLHLALSRLGQLDDPVEGSRRLFMADGLLRAGVSPAALLKALGQAGETSTLKFISDPHANEPRVPPGNHRQSGEWTTSEGAAAAEGETAGGVRAAARVASAALETTGRARVAAALDLGALSDDALASVGTFVAGLAEAGVMGASVLGAGAAAAFGILFIPNPVASGKWVRVGGPGNVSYFQKPDELGLNLRYTTPDGAEHTITTTAGPGGSRRSPDGRVLARWVKAGAKISLVISTATLLHSETEQREKLDLCPVKTPDKKHGNLRALAYENYIKLLMNPKNPTPPGFGYRLFNPVSGKQIFFDDCIHATGVMVEAKGIGYRKLLRSQGQAGRNTKTKLLKQAYNQINASQGRPILWWFAEREASIRARELLEKPRKESNMRVGWLPWVETMK